MGSELTVTELSDKLIELESQLAFQEHVIQSLDDIVTRQQGQIERLNEMLKNTRNDMDLLREAGGEKNAASEKPPHY